MGERKDLSDFGKGRIETAGSEHFQNDTLLVVPVIQTNLPPKVVQGRTMGSSDPTDELI